MGQCKFKPGDMVRLREDSIKLYVPLATGVFHVKPGSIMLVLKAIDHKPLKVFCHLSKKVVHVWSGHLEKVS